MQTNPNTQTYSYEEINTDIQDTQTDLYEQTPEYYPEYYNVRCFVDRVIDGDTIQCRNNMRIRLAGIDAPELRTDIGKRSRIYAKNIIGFKLSCDVFTIDKYGRYIARCFNSKRHDIAAKIVFAGYAFNCGEFPNYKEEQKSAQKNNKSMWRLRHKPKRKSWC